MKNKEDTKQQKLVDDWNHKYNIGQKVVVTMDDGTKFQTVTRSEAALLGGHTAVIWLEGIPGCYLLDRVVPDTSKREVA